MRLERLLKAAILKQRGIRLDIVIVRKQLQVRPGRIVVEEVLPQESEESF